MRILMLLLLALLVAIGASAQVPPAPASPPPAPASAPPANPYSATVPVAGTTDADRSTAIATALTQVLQQVSPGLAVGANVLAQASGYVRDYRYQRATTGNGLQLQVDFDPGAVTRLVADAQGVAAGSSVAAPASGASAARVAQGGSGAVWVDGIHDSHAFASVLSVLRGDPDLHDVTPIAAEGDGVLLRLDFDQPLTTVLAGLTGPAGHLTVQAQPHPGAEASLRWTP